MAGRLAAPWRSGCMVLLSMALALAGCHSRYYLNRSELKRLSGFREGETRYVFDHQGQAHPFDEGTELQFVFQDGRKMSESFSYIQVSGGYFEGRSTSGEILRGPLDEVRSVSISEFSGEKLLILTIGGGIAVIMIGMFVIIVVSLVATGGLS